MGITITLSRTLIPAVNLSHFHVLSQRKIFTSDSLYVCRRKLRKVRSRSNYVLHDTDTTTGSSHGYDAYAKSGNTVNSFSAHGRPTPIYRPFRQDSTGEDGGIGTWQRTRPLPVPTRLYRSDNRSRDSCDDTVDEDDENVIAMTPMTSTSEHPLLTPTTDIDAGLFNITAASCGVQQCDSSYAPDAVRNFVASQWRSNETVPSSTHLQQPIDAARLLLCPDAPMTGGTGGPGYERCLGLRECPSQQQAQSSGKGPYYFKLDLTAGLGGASEEHMTGSSTSQCLVCRHQQQQHQRGGTLHRQHALDQSGRVSACSSQQLSAEQRY